LIRETIKEDYVRADIYFQTLNVQTLTEDPKYTVSKK